MPNKFCFIDNYRIFIESIKHLNMETYKFDGGEVSLIKDNVLLIEYEKSRVITTRNLFNLKSLREKLIGNRSFYTITDTRAGFINLSIEAKAYVADANNSSKYRLGDAILVDSFAKKIEVELYMRFYKPVVKTKTFTDLNKALCWVERLELEHEKVI